jgi:hypothetical protein
MKTPRKHLSRDSSHEQLSGANQKAPIPIPASHHVEGHDRPNVDSHDTSSTGTGISSYFPASIPRRLSSLLSSTPAPAQVSPFARTLTQRPVVHDSFAGISEENDLEDTQPVFTVPAGSSIATLSSVPLPNHAGPLDATSSTQPRASRPVPDAFLTHSNPFATIKYVPPTGAPGFKGDHDWDTGNFREEWEDDMAGAL